MKRRFLYILILILSLGLLSLVGIFNVLHNCKSDTYESDTLKVNLEHVENAKLQQEYWIATITVKDMKQVNSAFAHDTFPGKKKQFVSAMARQNQAIFAVNGTATGFSEAGIIIRNGVIYRDKVFDCAPLEMRKDGTLFIGEYSKRTAQQILEDGALHTWDFCPDLIVNGQVTNYVERLWFSTDRAPRTIIGQKEAYEYIFLVADGRRKDCPGMSYLEAANILLELGCSFAYALDGGGSTTLYFKGRVVNHPSGIIQRPYSDILYFVN
ncbi:phosphodiester glycosidase family protein [Niameybacter massiliensis]|uniref:phosphodiester glycosidase family protein n=1 Tax=Niameybacter massiliensis TaxID=1658108 RepID=UPI0006B46117|nr:phosphodiester glycosidase family protein [Niameybacter massiliensis]